MRLMAATVMSTASLIALSAHASDWADCICSAISCMRRWKSGSLKKLPKPSMPAMLLGVGRRRAGRADEPPAARERDGRRAAAGQQADLTLPAGLEVVVGHHGAGHA